MRRLRQLLPIYVQALIRTEWQLGLPALGGLAPGVATVTAWLALARLEALGDPTFNNSDWLLPQLLLAVIGVRGVLVGAGVVTLLIGCLGLTNVYLAGLEKRTFEHQLLIRLGLPRRTLFQLLLLEVFAVGAVGSLVGVLLGSLLYSLALPAAVAYFEIGSDPSQLTRLIPPAQLLSGFVIGIFAALLFMGLVAFRIVFNTAPHGQRQRGEKPLRTSEVETTLLGTLFAALLMAVVAFTVLPVAVVIPLVLISAATGLVLTGTGWLLTHGYARLPTPNRAPLWTLAVEGLVQRPNYTAGMVLALTSGAYAIGLATLNWFLAAERTFLFPFFVAAMVVLAAAALVLTAAALSLHERRREYGLLMAMGATRRRIWRLSLMQYGIVALGSGLVGVVLVWINIALTAFSEPLWILLLVLPADVIGAILTAWAGVLPILAMHTRRMPGELLQ